LLTWKHTSLLSTGKPLRALSFCERADKHGEVDALYDLGRIYENDDPNRGESNWRKALRYYCKDARWQKSVSRSLSRPQRGRKAAQF
jgi:hypothetical protein